MTNEDRAALVHKVAAKVAGEACPGGTPPCVEEGYHRESCGCMDVAAVILAAIEPAIRADERRRVVEDATTKEAVERAAEALAPELSRSEAVMTDPMTLRMLMARRCARKALHSILALKG